MCALCEIWISMFLGQEGLLQHWCICFVLSDHICMAAFSRKLLHICYRIVWLWNLEYLFFVSFQGKKKADPWFDYMDFLARVTNKLKLKLKQQNKFIVPVLPKFGLVPLCTKTTYPYTKFLCYKMAA